eukprot:GFUD01002561.1.p1 GENE.GFUD01002561.1~~GFUD01002561.1.p1  ORF type:complete len:239 (+),score=104.22 GFUD01002561.1:309-1025(+)
MAEEASEDKEDITTELDQVIPKHKLLDNTAAKHKTELVHRGTLASRHRPSGEGLRTQILRRQQADSKEGSPVSKCQEGPPPPPPPSSSPVSVPKNIPTKTKPGTSFLADIQAAQKTKCKDDSDDSPTEDSGSEDLVKQGEENEKPAESSKDPTSPTNSPISKPKPSFLSEMINSHRKKVTDESGQTISQLKSVRKVKPKSPSNPLMMENSGIQDQLRLKLEARKKLVEETDEGAETET